MQDPGTGTNRPTRPANTDAFGYQADEVLNLQPEDDFSPQAAARREQAAHVDATDTYRELSHRQVRDDVAAARAPGVTTPLLRAVVAGTPTVNYWSQQASALLAQEYERRKPRDISDYKAVNDIIDAAHQQGVRVSSEDIVNAVDFGMMNSATDRIIAASKVGDEVAVRNIALTMQKTSPEMAALLPDYVNDRLIEAIEDPTIMAQASEAVLKGLTWLATPFVAASEWTMEGVRAGTLEINESVQGSDTYNFAPGDFARGFVSGESRSQVREGMFNQEYLAQIRSSGKYDPLQIEIAIEVSKRAAQGDPDPIVSTWKELYSGNKEAAPIFQDIMYNRATGNTQELLRQIDSAHMGNSGQTLFGAADDTAKFDPARAGETRQDVANVAGVVASVALDPTLLFGRAGRLVQAAKWGLERLAPGAESASQVLKKARMGGLAGDSPAYRYFNNFTRDLNTIDDLEARALAATTSAERTKLQTQAAGLRQRMVRQYDEMPEELIEDFRTLMPKNADGKFDVETAAAYIDDTNEAYLVATGNIADSLAAEGATEASKRALMEQLYNEATFYGRVSARNQRRTALIPRMSVAAAARKRAVNSLAFQVMPHKKSVAIINNYLANDGTADDFASALSGNAVELGAAVRSFKFSPGEGFFDSASRSFSSLPDGNYVNVAQAEDATRVYKLARTFFPKRVAETIADAFRRGDTGSRRLIMSGMIRSAAASRGITLTEQQADVWVKSLTQNAKNTITGSRQGEQYGASIPGTMLPSERAAAVRAGAKPDDLLPAGDEFISLSADANGIENALHVYQTSDYVHFPTLKDFEDLRSDINMGIVPVGRIRNAGGMVAQKAVDYWSIGTLFGLRFSLRNAIEEVGLSWLTGAQLSGLYKGRKASQVLRRARPHFYVKEVKVPGTRDTELRVVMKSSLGMFANKAEWVSRQSQERGFPEWIAHLLLPAVDRDAALRAATNMADGDPEAFSNLAIAALAAQKRGVNLVGLSADEEMAFRYLTTSSHGMQLLDEIAEAGKYLNSGGMPAFTEATRGIDEVSAGVGFGKIDPGVSPVRFGAYGDIPVIEKMPNGAAVFGSAFWWRELQHTMIGDGPIGEAAVRGLVDPVAAKAEIAKIIREDTDRRYKDIFSSITDDASIDRFASMYFENVFQHFTKKNGTLNMALRDRFMSADGKAHWADQDVDGDWIPRVSMEDLKQLKVNERPEFVFGREVVNEPYVPVAETLPAFFSVDRAFGWMGRQNARISREPIFLNNYFDQFNKTAAARRDMAEALARNAGREVNDIDLEIASNVYARQALDNAYNLTLSFVDNPANRSNLAWKARNVSRYYRATEDFYRRSKRVAQVSPESYWKAALIYSLLDDTGFVYDDDNGDRYFAYPGNELMQDAVANVANKMFGIDFQGFQDVDPFFMGGKVLSMTPSSDPNQMFASFAGPMSAAPLAAVFHAFPALGGLRSALMGQYFSPSGNVWSDIVSTILPAGVTKALRLTDPDQLESSITQAGVDTIALMTAEGLLDKVTINGREVDAATLTPAEFRQSDQYKMSQSIAVGSFATKTIMSYFMAASPQSYSNTVSDTARGWGIDSMEDGFRDMIEANKDEVNPFASAVADWYAMKARTVTDGEFATWDTMMPFTVSSTKPNREDGGLVSSLANVQIYDTLVDWYREPGVQDLERNGFGAARFFLAPRNGEFSWEAWGIAQNVLKLRVKKTEEESIQELFALEGSRMDSVIREDYAGLIAAARTEEEADELRKKEELDRLENRMANPAWDRMQGSPNGSYTQANLRETYSQTRDMLAYLRERDGELTGPAQEIENVINIWSYYSGKKATIQGVGSVAAKAAVEAEMAAELEAVTSLSENARVFKESVLDSLSFNEKYANVFGSS